MTHPPLDEDAIVGCLLGQAIGDMMGLPAENLTPRRIAKLFPNLDRPRFLFGYGMGSDDTEHACMTAQALLRSGGNVERFRRSLAWRLRWWFAAAPAGIGLATARACIKLWLGWPPYRSGVYSAGNGPAMRAVLLAACCGEVFSIGYIDESTILTHKHRKARFCALMLGNFARQVVASKESPDYDWAASLRGAADWAASNFPDNDLAEIMKVADNFYRSGRGVSELVSAIRLSRGVTGYIAHTVPVAMYAFCRHPDDYRAAVESVIRCGGDTDTVAAITGALVGARVGKAGIPKEWLDRYGDWPRSAAWIEALGKRVAEGNWRESPQPALPLAWWAIPLRNLAFFLIVLAHIARRLLPPY